jgi:hypothetical protein
MLAMKKLLSLSSFARMRRAAAGRIALLAFPLAACRLGAAPALAAERPLTDADVALWLPRLRAEAAAFADTAQKEREAIAETGAALEARETLLADMASGKVDILAWLRASVPQVFIPADAVYCAECSQTITGEMRRPAAVFTFRKESQHRDLLRRAASGDASAADEFHKRRGEEEQGAQSAEGKKASDFAAELASQYRSRGYTDSEGIPISILITSLNSPDGNLFVMVSEVNYYCGLLPRPVPPPCSALPTGPIVEISFEGDMLHPALPRDAGGGAADGASGAAAGAGSSGAEAEPDPEYERVRNALFLARADAEYPSAIEVEIPPDAPAEVKAELAKISAEYAVRRSNVLVYKKHEAVLAPLLEALMQLSNE